MTASLKVEVAGNVLSNLTEIKAAENRTVSYGTTWESLNLPADIQVTLDDGTKKLAGVTWSGDYNGNKAGIYTLTGTIISDGSFENRSDLTASMQVTVKEKKDDGTNPGDGQGQDNGKNPNNGNEQSHAKDHNKEQNGSNKDSDITGNKKQSSIKTGDSQSVALPVVAASIAMLVILGYVVVNLSKRKR